MILWLLKQGKFFIQSSKLVISELNSYIRFYIDPETGSPHIYKHDVRENEVEDVLKKPGEDRPGKENSRIAIGQTKGGRYLRVIYVPDPEPDSVILSRIVYS